MNTICDVANAPIETMSSSAAAVTMRPRALQADRDGLVVGCARVARLLDPGQQKHAVVGARSPSRRETK